MNQYLALLRGINVGGNNIIKMVDLKACFEKMGFTDVKT
ncbi:MAG: cytoplasmic protein, partial [Flavobacteriales bacterium CG18_big_fil_WC_8_21_14_2_50_32_9]